MRMREYDSIEKDHGWKWARVLCLALMLPLLAACPAPFTDDQLELYSQAQDELQGKQAAVDPVERYSTAMDGLEVVLDAVLAVPGLVPDSDILVLRAIKKQAQAARLAVFKAALVATYVWPTTKPSMLPVDEASVSL